MMRSGIELEVEELANQSAQPPSLESVVDAMFAIVDDYRQNVRDGLPVICPDLRKSCEALCSTVEMLTSQRQRAAVARQWS